MGQYCMYSRRSMLYKLKGKRIWPVSGKEDICHSSILIMRFNTKAVEYTLSVLESDTIVQDQPSSYVDDLCCSMHNSFITWAT